MKQTYVFDEPKAILINKARIKHLASLKLDLFNKRVIDVGCGVGYLAQFFVKNNCRVFCIDGRKDNISSLRSRYPTLKGRVVDVEKEDLSKYGLFDIVFCYGLLYHTQRPDFVLKNISKICRDLIILETCITDSPQYDVKFVKDTPAANQALYGVGCRPSPRFVISHLRACGFSNVYLPRTAPKHQDFEFKYKGDGSSLNEGHLIRQIFIASRTKLVNANLVPISDGHEFYQKDFLLKLPYPLLKILAGVVFRPRNFLSVIHWQVGSTENELSRYRDFLKRLWNVLEIKSAKTTKLIINWYNKTKLTIYLDSETSRCIYVEGLYEPVQFSFLNLFLKKGMVFVDVGANIGLYSIFAASLLGKNGQVFAFEPSRREYIRLLQNTKKFPKVIRNFKYAIGSKNQWANLKIADNLHSGHNTLGQFVYKKVKPIREEKVKTVTLDWFIDRQRLARVDVLKIDVEGHENHVLIGSDETIKKLRPLILMEISSGSAVRFLKKYRYYIYTFNDASGNLTRVGNIKTGTKTLNIVASPEPLSIRSFK